MHLLQTLQENMTRMMMITDAQDIIKKHQPQIITSLKDPDIRLVYNILYQYICYWLWTKAAISGDQIWKLCRERFYMCTNTHLERGTRIPCSCLLERKIMDSHLIQYFSHIYLYLYLWCWLLCSYDQVYWLVQFACSIRRRALDLLYGMCDVSNAKGIVEELLQVVLSKINLFLTNSFLLLGDLVLMCSSLLST